MHSSTIPQKRPEGPSKELQPRFSSITKTFIALHGIVIPHERKSCFGDFFQKKKQYFLLRLSDRRKGMECKKCGACCRLIVLQHSNPTKKSLEYYRVRGWTFDPVTDLVWIPSVCPHLHDNNTCKIYKSRPKQCRLYPTRTPGLVVPRGCAFEN